MQSSGGSGGEAQGDKSTTVPPSTQRRLNAWCVKCGPEPLDGGRHLLAVARCSCSWVDPSTRLTLETPQWCSLGTLRRIGGDVTSRDEIFGVWRDCLEGRITREEAASWARERAWTPPPEQIAEEIGLQCLYQGAGWSSSDGVATIHWESEQAFRELLSRWVETCTLLDEGATGTVWLSEVMDLDGLAHKTLWTGRFSGHWGGSVPLILNTPESRLDMEGMAVDDAIEWACARAETVTLRTRTGENFSAGRKAIKDLPGWTGNVDLSPIEEWNTGEEWREGFRPGTRIEWRVTCKTALVPNDEDHLQEFAALLSADETVLSWEFGVPPRGIPPREKFPREVVVIVDAASEEEAQQLGSGAVLRAASAVVRRHGATGRMGFTVCVDAKPFGFAT